MGDQRALQVKARAVLRQLGHSEGDPLREYKDWHIDVRSGASYLSIWHSGCIVFLSMANVPVYYQPGEWETYLERLFQRTT
jgi:hypothetical protein